MLNGPLRRGLPWPDSQIIRNLETEKRKEKYDGRNIDNDETGSVTTVKFLASSILSIFLRRACSSTEQNWPLDSSIVTSRMTITTLNILVASRNLRIKRTSFYIGTLLAHKVLGMMTEKKKKDYDNRTDSRVNCPRRKWTRVLCSRTYLFGNSFEPQTIRVRVSWRIVRTITVAASSDLQLSEPSETIDFSITSIIKKLRD